MTALQMGHATTDTLFKHYRNYRIRKANAEAYWSLAPRPRGKKVVTFAGRRSLNFVAAASISAIGLRANYGHIEVHVMERKLLS
jgi:hypothetical protein